MEATYAITSNAAFGPENHTKIIQKSIKSCISVMIFMMCRGHNISHLYLIHVFSVFVNITDNEFQHFLTHWSELRVSIVDTLYNRNRMEKKNGRSI